MKAILIIFMYTVGLLLIEWNNDPYFSMNVLTNLIGLLVLIETYKFQTTQK